MILPEYLHADPVAVSYLLECAEHAAAGLSSKPGCAFGFERRHNKAFRIGDEDAFLHFILATNAGIAAE